MLSNKYMIRLDLAHKSTSKYWLAQSDDSVYERSDLSISWFYCL